jgi:NAD(P)-dependent dehydrogenase (short-subunit alcohol dehydrogenase family)
MGDQKVVIVTGSSRGMGAAVAWGDENISKLA